MKKIMFSTVILISGIFVIGCGSGEDTKDSPPKSDVDNVLKLSEVVYNAPRDIDFNNKTRMQLKRKVVLMKQRFGSMQKVEVEACSESGTFSYEIFADNSEYYSYDNCIDYDSDTDKYEYMHGSIKVSADGNTMIITQFTDIPDAENDSSTGTYTDGTIIDYTDGNIEESYLDASIQTYNNDILEEDMEFYNFTFKYDNLRKASYFDGRYYYKSGCLKEDYTFETDNNNWLVENSINSDYYSSGTVTVDNIKYVYSGTDVTVTKDNKTRTFTQQELIDELNNIKNSSDSSCSQQGNFGV